jgi:hypothetical protein
MYPYIVLVGLQFNTSAIHNMLYDAIQFQVVGDARNRTLTLIEREDELRKFSGLFLTLYHNVMPSKRLGIHTYRLLASQEYARC